MKQPVPRQGVSLGLWTCGITESRKHQRLSCMWRQMNLFFTQKFISQTQFYKYFIKNVPLLKRLRLQSDFGLGVCVCACASVLMEIHDVCETVRQGERLQRKSTALIGCCLCLRSLQEGVPASCTWHQADVPSANMTELVKVQLEHPHSSVNKLAPVEWPATLLLLGSWGITDRWQKMDGWTDG